MTDGTLSQEEVIDFLGISLDTLRKWRATTSIDTSLHLPAVPGSNPSRYAVDTLLAFLQRNDIYRDRVLAAFAPARILEQLRGYVPVDPPPLPAEAWDGYFSQEARA